MTTFGFDLKLCRVCSGMPRSLCHTCYRSCSYIVYRVTKHDNYTALDFCKVRRVNFLKPLNYLIKVCLEVNIKQLT